MAILNNEKLVVPDDFKVNEENILRFYKAYGDLHNRGKGAGDAQIVTANILNEYKSKYCRPSNPLALLPTYLNVFETISDGPPLNCSDKTSEFNGLCDPEIIDRYLINPNERSQMKQKLRLKEYWVKKNTEGTDVTADSLKLILNAISSGFRDKPRLPIEFIHGGNGLNFTPEGEMPSPKNRSRDAHVSLITGRRLTSTGECQILIRNSYRTNCRPRVGVGRHWSTKRECEGPTDSTWFSESHIKRFVGGVRITHPQKALSFGNIAQANK